jgi:hypothetical protein
MLLDLASGKHECFLPRTDRGIGHAKGEFHELPRRKAEFIKKCGFVLRVKCFDFAVAIFEGIAIACRRRTESTFAVTMHIGCVQGLLEGRIECEGAIWFDDQRP